MSHAGRAIFERDSNDQASRDASDLRRVDFFVLTFLSAFRRVFGRVRFCCHLSRGRDDDDDDDNDSLASCITRIEKKTDAGHVSDLSFAIGRQMFIALMTS